MAGRVGSSATSTSPKHFVSSYQCTRKGIIHLAVDQIFDELGGEQGAGAGAAQVKFSLCEIYVEKVTDLIQPGAGHL